MDLFEELSKILEDYSYFNDNADNMIMSGTLVLFITITFAVFAAVVYFFYKKRWKDDYENKYLTFCFVIVWGMGFIVYDIGMCPDTLKNATEAFWAALGVAPMAILHSFEMFVLQSDVSAIHEGCHNSITFMTFFSLSHLSAAIISLVFVIKHFGFNVVSWLQRFWKTRIRVQDVTNLYVFWGINEASYHLATDVIRKERGEKSLSRIMVVRINNEKEGANERLAMERLFNFLSLSKDNLTFLQELQKSRCLTASTFGNLVNGSFADNSDILQKVLRLHSLVRMIRHTKPIHRSSATLHMFFLGEDETFNINALANLRKDKTIKDFANLGGNVRLYCNARYNSIHRVIEDQHNYKNTEVLVIDPSHIFVELLKKNVNLHPVNYVEVEDNAVVSSAFNALVVGFGAIGVDAVSFLYEFGAFVGKNVRGNGNVERSEFHCHVVDKQMNTLAGTFVANVPTISVSVNSENFSPPQAINLYNIDCQSVDFYKKVVSWLPTLNYVVLSTDNDDLNISMAVRILKLAIRHKDDLNKFRILVRYKGDNYGNAHEIVEHYNRLWNAENNRQCNDLSQNVVLKDDVFDSPITIFGSPRDIYTFDNIIDESLKDLASQFKYKYDTHTTSDGKAFEADPTLAREWWNNERSSMLHMNDDDPYSPTFSEVMKLRRVQGQNFSNCLHIGTKRALFERAMKMNVDDIVCKIIREKGHAYKCSNDNNSETVPIDRIQDVLDVLAQTEHLRWNASHEILGYTNDAIKDEAKMRHNCLVEWSLLDDSTKECDYNVVDVSLGIMMKKQIENNNERL